MKKISRANLVKISGALLWMSCLPAMAQDPIVLKHGNATYESEVGTSCWRSAERPDTMCDDHFGEVTSSTPIVLRRNDSISFEIPEREKLESMTFAVARVTSKDIRKDEADRSMPEYIFWERHPHLRTMTKSQRESIVINQPPGDYILVMYGFWADHGDAMHGFYLRVTQ